MDARYSQLREAVTPIEGMLSEFSIALMDALLDEQARRGVPGNMIEFGVYKGRSAGVLASHAKPGERLILVDIDDHLDRARLNTINPKFEFIRCASEKFKSSIPAYPQL